MSGGSEVPDKTTQTTELPVWAQPYAQNLLARTGSLSEQPLPVYTGQRTANLNQYQSNAAGMVANRALNGSAEINAGSNNLTDTLNGNYLSQGNPYLGSVIDRASQDVIRNYQGAVGNNDAMFARNGAFGGSAWQQAQEGQQRQLAQGLSDVASGMRYQNYDAERARQMQGIAQALPYGNQAYTDAQALQGAGQQQYAYDQSVLDDYRSMWDDMAQSPYKQLDILANGIRGAVGGGGQVTQTGPSSGANSGLAQGIGMASSLYGLLK